MMQFEDTPTAPQKGVFKVAPGEDCKALLRDAHIIEAYLKQRSYAPHANNGKEAYAAWKRFYQGLQLAAED